MTSKPLFVLLLLSIASCGRHPAATSPQADRSELPAEVLEAFGRVKTNQMNEGCDLLESVYDQLVVITNLPGQAKIQRYFRFKLDESDVVDLLGEADHTNRGPASLSLYYDFGNPLQDLLCVHLISNEVVDIDCISWD